jgi:hypothetical protein
MQRNRAGQTRGMSLPITANAGGTKTLERCVEPLACAGSFDSNFEEERKFIGANGIFNKKPARRMPEYLRRALIRPRNGGRA